MPRSCVPAVVRKCGHAPKVYKARAFATPGFHDRSEIPLSQFPTTTFHFWAHSEGTPPKVVSRESIMSTHPLESAPNRLRSLHGYRLDRI
jgi:hypothetical protein